jgi:hypothetical protein
VTLHEPTALCKPLPPPFLSLSFVFSYLVTMMRLGSSQSMYQVPEKVPALHSEGWGLCERFELLLLHGADVNAAGDDSDMALHFSSRLRRAQK